MSAAYDDMLKRLAKERYRLALSQREMGRYMRMSQSNYSKVELGKRRLSYYELKYLCDSDIDMYYVFTGKRCSGKYREYFLGCSYSELLCILNIITSVADLRSIRDHADSGRFLSVWTELAWTTDRGQKLNRNLFHHIRKLLGHSQKEMAEMLGMDVKKLRELENGRSQPDSELLCRVYELFHVPPAIVLQDKGGLVSEICCQLEVFGPDSGEELFRILRWFKT